MFVFGRMALCPNRVLEIPLPLTSSYFSWQQVVLFHQVVANPLLVSGGGFHSSTNFVCERC